MSADNTLRILLIEDTPGDARLVREMLRDAPELSGRTRKRGRELLDDGAGATGDTPALVHEKRLADGVARLDEESFDAALLDLNLPDNSGIETLTELLAHSGSVPVVVLTGVRDRETGLAALDAGADEYLVKGELTADLLVRSVFNAIERKEYERRLRAQRDQLATLNSLSELVREVTHLAIESVTRAEIEACVCDHLADSEPYCAAWVGTIDRSEGRVRVRTEAGPDGVDSVPLPPDGDAEGAADTDEEADAGADEGIESIPAAIERAVETGQTQVARRCLESDAVHWEACGGREDVRSFASVPVVYEGTLYAVLNVLSPRPDAFAADERDIVSRLGEVVGHTVVAVERKRTLMSDDVVELEFQVPTRESLGVDAPAGTVSFVRTVPLGDGLYHRYGVATDDAIETLDGLVDNHPHVEDVTLFDDRFGETRFELRVVDPPLVTAVASLGGHVHESVIEDGDLRVVVRLPPSADVRGLVEFVTGEYPDAVMLSREQLSREETSLPRLDAAFADELTERQRTALETAFFSGYFEWPREQTGEDVADSMNISPPTFHHHLRDGTRRLLATLFDSERKW